MIKLPNIEKTKWNDYQPQISKINSPQTGKKSLNFEIMVFKKLNRAIKHIDNSDTDKNTRGRYILM